MAKNENSVHQVIIKQ